MRALYTLMGFPIKCKFWVGWSVLSRSRKEIVASKLSS